MNIILNNLKLYEKIIKLFNYLDEPQIPYIQAKL